MLEMRPTTSPVLETLVAAEQLQTVVGGGAMDASGGFGGRTSTAAKLQCTCRVGLDLGIVVTPSNSTIGTDRIQEGSGSRGNFPGGPCSRGNRQ